MEVKVKTTSDKEFPFRHGSLSFVVFFFQQISAYFVEFIVIPL